MTTVQDVEDVVFKQAITTILGMAAYLEIAVTPEAAIRFMQDGHATRPFAQSLAQYHRGVALNKRYVLITSRRTRFRDEVAADNFRAAKGVDAVYFSHVGYTAGVEHFRMHGLRTRTEGEGQNEQRED